MLAGGIDHKQQGSAFDCSKGQQRDPDNKAKVYVSVEFVIDFEDFQKHTYFVNVFCAAVSEWAKHLPIRTTFYYEGVPGLEGGDPQEERSRVITIVFADIHADPYNYDKSMIGMWQPWQRRIIFDTEYFQANPSELYGVALHELGHMFGVPHIVNKNELGFTGYLVLQEGDARDYVMYPKSFEDRPQNILSDVEIEFAKHQVMFIFSLDSLSKQAECQIAVDKLK